jgi:hypothetical protein
MIVAWNNKLWSVTGLAAATAYLCVTGLAAATTNLCVAAHGVGTANLCALALVSLHTFVLLGVTSRDMGTLAIVSLAMVSLAMVSLAWC